MNGAERELIIAIDGPSGVGKSTLSKRLAGALDYVNLDTGAMYRAVALAAQRRGIDPGDGPSLAALCQGLRIEFLRGRQGERVLLDGEDVSEEIRTPEVSLLTSRVAACLEVRQALVALQRQLGQGGGVVLEGRDIGTVVFPEAEVKFFLLASAAERARRRFEELRAKGVAVELDRTLREVEARDAADSAREHAPLLQAEDAVPIDTTQMTIEQVLAEMLRIVGERRAGLGGAAS
jgi:CMP/dCMP kinase